MHLFVCVEFRVSHGGGFFLSCSPLSILRQCLGDLLVHCFRHIGWPVRSGDVPGFSPSALGL